MTTDSLQQEMVAYLDLMDELNPGKAGDYSLCDGKQFLVTPTGVRYGQIEPGDFPTISQSGDKVNGELDPSSETETHRAIYQHFDAGAVVHTHSPWITTLAALGESPDFVHYVAAVAGTEIPLVTYETYGTERLAEAIVETLTDHDARGCVMENHGFLCYGESLDDAFDVAEAVEFTARVDCQSRMIGTPNELSPEEVRDVADKFEGYGQSQ